MKNSYLEAVKNLWTQGQYGSERATAYLRKKRELLGLEGDLSVEADMVVATLEEGLKYISQIAEPGQATDFAIQELKEYCSIKNCEGDFQTILDAFDAGVQPQAARAAAPAALPVEPSRSLVAHPPAERPDQLGGGSEGVPPEMGEDSNTNHFWVQYIDQANKLLKELAQAIGSLNSAEGLLRLDAPAACRRLLDQLAESVSAALVARGDYADPLPSLTLISGEFMARSLDFSAALKESVTKKRVQTEAFSGLNRGNGSHFYGAGAAGMVGAAVANGMSSIFSSIGRHMESRQFDSTLDRQIWLSFEPALASMQEWLAEIVIAYYDVYAERTGGASFNAMHSARSESDYILKNLENIPPAQRLDALRRALKLFPYRASEWLTLIGDVRATTEERLKLLKLAERFYTGDPNALLLQQATLAYELGNWALVRNVLATLDLSRPVQLPRFPGWLLDSLTIPAKAKICLLAGYLEHDLNDFFRVRMAAPEDLEGLFNAGDAVATAERLIALLNAWRRQNWDEVDALAGALVSVAPSGPPCELLLSIPFAKVREDAMASAQTAIDFLRGVGLEAVPVMPKNWAGNGDEFKLARSLHHFIGGEYDKARAEIIDLNPIRTKIPIPTSLSWPFQEEIAKVRNPELAGLIYRAYLVGELHRCHRLDAPTASMLVKLAEEFGASEEAVTSVFRLIRLMEEESTEALLDIAQELIEHAESSATESFLCAVMLDCLTRLGREEDLRELALSAAGRGFTLGELQQNWDCSRFAAAFEEQANSVKEAFRVHAFDKVEDLNQTWPNLIQKFSLGSLCKSTVAADEILRRFNANTDGAAKNLCPTQVYAYWLSPMSLGLITLPGLYYINYKTQTWHWISWLHCGAVDESGLINTYLRIRTGSSKVEIPFDISGPDRGNMDAICCIVDAFAHLWSSGREADVDYGMQLDMDRFVDNCANLPVVRHTVVEVHCQEKEFSAALRSVSEQTSVSEAAEATALGPLAQAASGYATDAAKKIWIGPNLDPAKIKEFCKNLPKSVVIRQGDIVAYYDDTLFGQGDDGILLTEKHLFYKTIATDMQMIPLADIQEMTVKTGFFGTTVDFKTSNGNVKFKMSSGSSKEAMLILQKIVIGYLEQRCS